LNVLLTSRITPFRILLELRSVFNRSSVNFLNFSGVSLFKMPRTCKMTTRLQRVHLKQTGYRTDLTKSELIFSFLGKCLSPGDSRRRYPSAFVACGQGTSNFVPIKFHNVTIGVKKGKLHIQRVQAKLCANYLPPGLREALPPTPLYPSVVACWYTTNQQ
jgi:hypothetical protein